MKIIKYLSLFALLLTSPSLYSDSDTLANFDNRIIHLEKLIHDAEKVNGLWRDTKKLMSQAIEEHNNNNTSKALELVELAEKQAKSGYQQATSQPNLDQLIPYYLK